MLSKGLEQPACFISAQERKNTDKYRPAVQRLKVALYYHGARGRRTHCKADLINLQKVALGGMIRNIQITLFIVMSLRQPIPSTLSREVMDGAVLSHSKHPCVSSALYTSLLLSKMYLH